MLFNLVGRVEGQLQHRQDFFGCRLIDGVLSFIKKTLADNIKSFDETPVTDCCLLLGTVAQGLHQSAELYVPTVIDIVAAMLKAKNTPVTQACSLFVVCSSLVALPLQTLEYCSNTGFWPAFQSAWIGGEVPEPGLRLKTISLLGKLTLLKLSSDVWSKVGAL